MGMQTWRVLCRVNHTISATPLIYYPHSFCVQYIYIYMYVTVQAKTSLVHTSDFAKLMAYWNVTHNSNFQ